MNSLLTLTAVNECPVSWYQKSQLKSYEEHGGSFAFLSFWVNLLQDGDLDTDLLEKNRTQAHRNRSCLICFIATTGSNVQNQPQENEIPWNMSHDETIIQSPNTSKNWTLFSPPSLKLTHHVFPIFHIHIQTKRTKKTKTQNNSLPQKTQLFTTTEPLSPRLDTHYRVKT